MTDRKELRVSIGSSGLHHGETEVLFFMERRDKPKTPTVRSDVKTISEKKAKEILSNPPKDRREVTIGPTSKTGPDVIVDLPEV